MKGLVYLILLSAFMLGACAHLDNGFMRSAEPLPKGDSRGFASVSSSYSYTPGLNFEPDSTLGLISRAREAALGFQLQAGLDIGVGKGFQIGGQLSLSPGPDFDNNEFFKDSYSPFSITNAFRGYVPDVFVLGLCAQRPCIHQYIFSG